MERYWVANGILASNECGGLVKYDDAQRALDAERRERHAVEQIAGQALGYPWFKDDQKNFPGATEADGVCIGEHVAGTIVQELASKLATLQAQLADRDAMILQMGEQAAVLAKENMAVKAQLRQVEGERAKWEDIAGLRFAGDHKFVKEMELLKIEHAKLRQLVEAYAKAKTVFDENRLKEDHHEWKERFNTLVEAEQALIEAAALAAQDAGKADVSHD